MATTDTWQPIAAQIAANAKRIHKELKEEIEKLTNQVTKLKADNTLKDKIIAMSKKRSYSTMSCGSSHITCTEPSDWCNDPTLKQPPNKRRRLNTQTNRRNYQQHNSENHNTQNLQLNAIRTTTKTKDTHKKIIEIPSPTKLIAMDIQTEEHLDELFRIGSVKREKAINLFRKILSKIVSFPNEEKYQSLNHAKISAKFKDFQCLFMIQLLLFAGFVVDGNRLKLKQNKAEHIINKLNNKIKNEQEKLERDRLEIIQRNKKRLESQANSKKQQLKNKILAQHKQQMNLAKKGVYNVGATVSDRKGTGNGVNSLGL